MATAKKSAKKSSAKKSAKKSSAKKSSAKKAPAKKSSAKKSSAKKTPAKKKAAKKSASHGSSKKQTLIKEKRSTGDGPACWPGYERVPGKEAGTKGSCKPKPHQTKGEKKADAKAKAGSKLQKAGGNKAKANRSK